MNRRYKTQLRDFLSTCRTKRKLSSHQSPHASPLTPHAPAVQSLNSPLLNTSNNLTNNNNINLNNNNSSPHLSTVMMDYLPTAAAENHLMTPIAAYHHHPNLYTQGGYGQTENALYMGQTFQTMYPDNLFHQYQRHHLTGYYTAADYQAAGGRRWFFLRRLEFWELYIYVIIFVVFRICDYWYQRLPGSVS